MIEQITTAVFLTSPQVHFHTAFQLYQNDSPTPYRLVGLIDHLTRNHPALSSHLKPQVEPKVKMEDVSEFFVWSEEYELVEVGEILVWGGPRTFYLPVAPPSGFFSIVWSLL